MVFQVIGTRLKSLFGRVAAVANLIANIDGGEEDSECNRHRAEACASLGAGPYGDKTGQDEGYHGSTHRRMRWVAGYQPGLRLPRQEGRHGVAQISWVHWRTASGC